MKPISLLRNAARSFSFSRNGFRPSSMTAPEVGCSSAPRIYSSVLLPLPDGPMMETASPGLSISETPERMRMGPCGDWYSLMRFVASSKSYDTVAPDEADAVVFEAARREDYPVSRYRLY